VDLVMGPRRLAVAGTVFLTPQDQDRQREANLNRGKRRVEFGRLLVPPTLLIESVSMGHESHDRETKRRWYAEFAVPNYWVLDAYQRTLECLVLEGDAYRLDAAGREKQTVRPAVFTGLEIELAPLWG
jgi:Uma2 family endonuclease